jgi:AcrR family transcriptional regulator
MPIPDSASAIAAAALDLLARGSVASLTVRAIAESAGTSTTGIYTYFGGKGGLLDALFIEGFDSFSSSIEQSVGSDPAARLRDATDRYRDWALAHPTHYLLMFASRAAGYTPGAAASEYGGASLNYLVTMVTDVLEATRVPAAPGPEPWVIANHVWRTLHGYVMLEIAGPGPHQGDPAAFFREGVDLMLAAHGLAP